MCCLERKNKMTSIKENQGVTLVALILTIIVLLMLAAASITLMIHQGIMQRSQRAAGEYNQANTKEQIALAYQEYRIAEEEDENLDFTTILTNTGLDVVKVETVNEGNYKVTVATKAGQEKYQVGKDGIKTEE